MSNDISEPMTKDEFFRQQIQASVVPLSYAGRLQLYAEIDQRWEAMTPILTTGRG